MNILLKEDVEKLGAAGDVVTVADGYARNYLIPQGLAIRATAGQVKQVDVIRRQAQKKRERLAAQMNALAEKLTGCLLTFEANASEKGRLYGSVTQDSIVEALEAKIGEAVDRRKLGTGPLRQIGLHAIPVRLSAELIPEFTVIVHREGEDPNDYLLPPEEEPSPEEEAATEEELTPAIVDLEESLDQADVEEAPDEG